jgi:hypothetical protein
MRRINWRASASAAAVTVQVLSTATWLCSKLGTSQNPAWSSCCLSAAPSAWLARHPKFRRWNVDMGMTYYSPGPLRSLSGRSYQRSAFAGRRLSMRLTQPVASKQTGRKPKLLGILAKHTPTALPPVGICGVKLRGSNCSTPLLETLPTVHGPTLRGSEGYRRLLAALGADRRGFNSALPLSPRPHRLAPL